MVPGTISEVRMCARGRYHSWMRPCRSAEGRPATAVPARPRGRVEVMEGPTLDSGKQLMDCGDRAHSTAVAPTPVPSVLKTCLKRRTAANRKSRECRPCCVDRAPHPVISLNGSPRIIRRPRRAVSRPGQALTADRSRGIDTRWLIHSYTQPPPLAAFKRRCYLRLRCGTGPRRYIGPRHIGR